jgi:hypothetical protein
MDIYIFLCNWLKIFKNLYRREVPYKHVTEYFAVNVIT